MRMLKRLSLVVATGLGICLLAPTGDAKDAGIASTLPSLGINLDWTGATGLISPTLDGRDSPIFASSQCCNQNDSSCCPLGASSEEIRDLATSDPQCFDLAELSAVDVSAAIGDDWIQATSHCCNTNVKTCCSQVAPSTIQEAPLSPEPESFDLAELNIVGDASAFGDSPLQASSHCCNKDVKTCCPLLPLPPGAVSQESLNWLQDSYGVSMEDLQSWSVAFVAPEALNEWTNPPYCCNEFTGVNTCCPQEFDNVDAGDLEAQAVIGEMFRRLSAMPSGIIQLWFDGIQRTRAVCLN